MMKNRKGNNNMLNSVQRTSNYQNSRMNFGMALNEKVIIDLNSAAQDVITRRKVEDLVKEASTNQDFHVIKARNSFNEVGTFIEASNGVGVPSSFVKGFSIESVTMQVKRAQDMSNAVFAFFSKA